MWKAFIYTLLFEVCLYGVGIMTVPVWLAENISIWLPTAFVVLLIMMCWDNWPRAYTWWMRFVWLDMESGARYFRDLLKKHEMKGEIASFDSMASPARQATKPVSIAFRFILEEALEHQQMEVWGVPENGSVSERITHIGSEARAYTRSLEEDEQLLEMDGVIYRNIEIRRSSIKSYVTYMRNKMVNLKQARDGNLDQFIQEHESDDKGDLDKLDAVIHKSVEKKQGATPAKKQRPET